MPRITPEHEEAIRRRILEAAARVFEERGFRDATIGDVVREAGISVGAIYTYFSSKHDLVRESCSLRFTTEIETLLAGLAGLGTTREKLERSIATWLDRAMADEGLATFLVHVWAESSSDPALREMLRRRRDRLVTVGSMLLAEGVARGELASGLDIDALARGFSALLDGLLLQRLEEGEAYRRADAEHRARAFLELLLRAGGTVTGS